MSCVTARSSCESKLKRGFEELPKIQETGEIPSHLVEIASPHAYPTIAPESDEEPSLEKKLAQTAGEDPGKLFKSTLNNRLCSNLACVIDESSRGVKLKRVFEELPLRIDCLSTTISLRGGRR